jgi:16S rRNA (guanine966-N2)-methyltransferase
MSGLRVIAGKARGHKLRSVPGSSTRPITDRVKESLFNIIGADIQEATLLDLFAGTGSVGIEALSRGARFVLFLDLDHSAISTIQINLKQTRLDSNAQVLQKDAFVFLERKPNQKFDYIYIAPPQYKGLWKKSLISLNERMEWLSDDAWVIVQIHPKEYEDLELSQMEEFDQRRYGSTLLVFYQRRFVEEQVDQ